MKFTGQLGTSQSQLANIILGSLPSGGVGIVNFISHVLDSKSVRVLFDRPMTESVLVASAYTIITVGGPYVVPTIKSVSFYDAAHRSVVITMTASFTHGGTYNIGVLGITAVDGAVPSGGTYNFSATVPDPPRAIGSCLSLRNMVDVIFDRAVGQYSTAATAIIKDSTSSASLTLVPWTSSIPANNVRFSLPGLIPIASIYNIEFSNVKDASSNTSSETIPLDLTLRSPQPFSISSFVQVQITNSYVDRVSNDYANTAAIRVFFNCPINNSDAINTSNWSALKQGAHFITDTVNQVITANPTDTGTLIAFANAFKLNFNNHVVQSGVHSPDIQSLTSDVISLTNDLLLKYNGHISSTSQHALKDTYNPVSLSGSYDLNSAITTLNLIKTKYNLHRVQTGIHSLNESMYVITKPSATDLNSAAVLADEIRFKFTMHDSNPNVHAQVNLFNPSIKPSLPNLIVCDNAVDLPNASGLLNEILYKYTTHIANDKSHVYKDDTNYSSLTKIPGASSAGSAVALYINNAISFATSLKNSYNGHLSNSYPVSILQVINKATSSTSFGVEDEYTYFCDVIVRSSSIVPYYDITSVVRSEDNLSTTNFLDYTGSIRSRSILNPPTVLSSVFSGSKLTITLDKEVMTNDFSSFRVTGSNGPIPIKSVGVSSTTRTLYTELTDLMTAYASHMTLSGHAVTDTTNVPAPGDFPTMSIASVIEKSNGFKNMVNSHILSGVYHNFSLYKPIDFPNSFDSTSAMNLIRSIRESFISHNNNVGLHNSLGPIQVSSMFSDSITIEFDGVTNSHAYSVSGSVLTNVTNLSGLNTSKKFDLNTSFVGIWQTPYLASVIPQIALIGTSTPSNPTPVDPIRFGSDGIVCFFSKSMNKVSVGPDNIRVTGGLLAKNNEWIDDRVLMVNVINMNSAFYQVDISGFSDKNNNQLPNFTLPPGP